MKSYKLVKIGGSEELSESNKSNKSNKLNKSNKSNKINRDHIYSQNEANFLDHDYQKLCDPHQYIPAILPARRRIVVFGDIHGDYKLMIDMLTKSKVAILDVNDVKDVTNNKIKWIGGDTCVVQVGDQIDRCRPLPGKPCTNPDITIFDEASDIKIMETFNDLHNQAVLVGGMVISLLGNHELLNVAGVMDYVSVEGIKQFENYQDPVTKQIIESGRDARIHAFKPGNQYAKMMGCTRLPAVIVGSNIFVHAGIIDALIDEISLKGLSDFERINISVRKWLLGLLDEQYVESIVKYSKNSMFWTRILGKIPPGVGLDNSVCQNNISEVLKLFKVGSIVIGHTPQSFMSSDDINSTCGGKVWRVDNGSSAAFNMFDDNFRKTGHVVKSRRTQYLEIINDSEYLVCDDNECHKEVKIIFG